jgi:hypothetical protein
LNQSHRKQGSFSADGLPALKFGSLPAAKDPDKPTRAELDAIRKVVVAYQAGLQHALTPGRPRQPTGCDAKPLQRIEASIAGPGLAS